MQRGIVRPDIVARIAVAAIVVGLSTGCDKPRSVGKVHEIVVATSPEVWTPLEQEIVAALEPSTFTVRDEQIFDVAYVAPTDTAWRRLRHMRQILLIGSAREPLIAEALDRRGADAFAGPVVVQVTDVWAKNQVVTIGLLPELAQPEVLRPLLPKINAIYREHLEDAVRIAMSATPTNERLAAQLRQLDGFTIGLPYAYDEEQPEPDLFVFRHEEPGGTPLNRTIIVNSRPRAGIDWTAEAARTWRAALARRVNTPPQLTETLRTGLQGLIAGQPTIQIQGVWSHPSGEWPSAGPFVARMVECSDRVFLIDASLYAPGDEKFGYMYRLDMILDTFRCPAEG